MIKLIFWWRHAINLMTYQGNRGNQRDDHLFRPDDHWFLKATGGCKDHPTSTEGVGVREPCWGHPWSGCASLDEIGNVSRWLEAFPRRANLSIGWNGHVLRMRGRALNIPFNP